MNIVKTSLLGLVLGLGLFVGNVQAGLANRPVNLGRVAIKYVADIYKAGSSKVFFEALRANLLATNHPVLANHPYATALGVVVGMGTLGVLIQKTFYNLGAHAYDLIEANKRRRQNNKHKVIAVKLPATA